MPSLFSDLSLFLLLVALFFVPGSACLVLSRTWQHWPGLQRLIVAVGLSIAVYPVLFYAARFLLPQLSLGAPWMAGLLIASAAVTGWGIWKHQLYTFQFSRLEWVAVALIGLTFVSRFWVVYSHPYPAWSDSLHHTLLTQLTAEHGRLPNSLEPFFPNTLDMYHLGLYAISGTVAMLAQVPAHTALLWTAQFLNSLAGIGIYLALDRYAGRRGAVVGLAIAGLFSAHPALWVNWGRFTQLSSQVLLLIAWVLTMESLTVRTPASGKVWNRNQRAWLLCFSALSTAALFLFHFRVAIFYLPLLGISLGLAFWQSRERSQRIELLKRLGGVGLISVFLVLPVLWAAAATYFGTRLAPQSPVPAAQAEQFRQNYYVFPLSTLPYLAAPIWLLGIGGLSSLFGLLRQNRLIVISLVWLVLLVILGNLYVLNIPVLAVTNFGAILIMFYLPLSLLIGAALEEALGQRERLGNFLMATLLLASLPAAYIRATEVEAYRHFITTQDVAAMAWIDANVPEDAVFAINTYFWFPSFAHGTDAGYWIPYFTGRQIVTSSMLSDGTSAAYRQRLLAQSSAAERVKTDLDALDELVELGVTYIYIGARGNFAGPGLQLDFLRQSGQVELLYEKDGTAVLQIHRRP
jgi:hypothetical protein